MLANSIIPPALTAAATITVDQAEAARLTKLSAKTLGRLADAGEPIGRVKINRRVLYVRSHLERWIESQLTAPTKTQTLGVTPSEGR